MAPLHLRPLPPGLRRSGAIQRMQSSIVDGAVSKRVRKAIVDGQGKPLVRRIGFETELIASMKVKRGNHRRHIIAQNVLIAKFHDYFSNGNGAKLSDSEIATYIASIGLNLRNTARTRAQLLSEIIRRLNSTVGNLFEDDGGENTSIGFLAPQVKKLIQKLQQCSTMVEAEQCVKDGIADLDVYFAFAKDHTEYVVDVLTDVVESMQYTDIDDVVDLLNDVVFSLNTDLPKKMGDKRSEIAMEVMNLLGDMNGKSDQAYVDNFWKALHLFINMG